MTNILSKNPYNKTFWKDEILDDTLPISDPNHIVEEGTPYMAEYANNFEEGIYNAYEYIIWLQNKVLRIEAQLEIDGRVDPINKGTYFDNFVDAPSKLTRLTTAATLTSAKSAGDTVLSVDTTNDFAEFTQVTIYDDVNSEDVLITAVSTNTITVQTLTHAYKKGAKITRSTVAIDTINKQMIVGSWDTYSISSVEVV